MDWGSLLSGGLSVATGGIFGLLGAVGTKLAEAWERKQQLDILKEQNKHAIDMKAADAAIMKEEWAQRAKVATIEVEGKSDVAASEAFAKSFASEPQRYSEGMKPPEGGWAAKFVQGLGWFLTVSLDVFRGSIRPGFAVYLAYIVTSMYNTQRAVLALLGADQGPEMAMVYVRIVDTMLFLFTTCVLWYYGIRNKQTPPKAA